MAKSKTKAPKGLQFKDATDLDLAAARAVIAGMDAHTFYTGRIYRLYNKITGRNEPAQNCASCLRTRAKAIRDWYAEGMRGAKKVKATNGVKVTNDAKPMAPVEPMAPVAEEITVPGVEVVLSDGASVFVDTAELVDGAKGVARYADGRKVQAGTYDTASGHVLKVAVAGKSTFVEVEDLT